MSLNRKRIRAVLLKEFREYRHNSLIIGTMAVIPAVVIAIPLVVLLILPASAAGSLSHDHFLLYLLAVPAVVPTVVAAYSVVGERQQGTLEPLLSTPVGREEFLLGKALAALAPSLAVSFLVYGIFIGCVSLFAQPTVASAVIKGSDIVTIILFAPLMASWPIWVGFSISARATDFRVAQQLTTFASFPPIAAAALLAFNLIHASLALAILGAAALLIFAGLGWRLMLASFDRERLITNTK